MQIDPNDPGLTPKWRNFIRILDHAINIARAQGEMRYNGAILPSVIFQTRTRATIMTPINLPTNLRSLHQAEERLRSQSIEAASKDDNLSAHLVLIECSMDTIDYFSRAYEHDTEDQLTVQLLGIRLFNGCSSSLKLLLSGYYQTSALQIRDIIETVFLLNYFTIDAASIGRWRTADDNLMKKEFSPFSIRTALDNRDGFKDMKRAALYKDLSTFAGHPTAKGFRMLRSVHDGDAHCGPFFEFVGMKSVIEELCKAAIQAAASLIAFFRVRSLTDAEMTLHFLEQQAGWFDRFYNNRQITSDIDELRAIVAALKGRP